MKRKMFSVVYLMVMSTFAFAQADERMERDIKVAEGVLSSLIKQQFQNSSWLPVAVEGSYRSGYGITFSVANFSNFPINYMVTPRAPQAPRVRVQGGQGLGYTYSIETDEEGEVVTEELIGRSRNVDKESKAEAEERKQEAEERMAEAEAEMADAEEAMRESERALQRSFSGVAVMPSGVSEKDKQKLNKILVDAAKTFLSDYSSILSQLKPEERIIITNRANEGNGRYWRFMSDEKRFFLSIEASAADIKQFQTNKLTKEQFAAKIKVVESEVLNERIQDLELLTTIIDRLYQPDLSKTYFTEENTYYERLKDFGAIFHMQVFSSNQLDRGYYTMPTQGGQKLSEEERNKKVKELYPAFEKELKENILEYGRTIRSLNPNESLIFNVQLTKCKGCEIPSTIEISTKVTVLTDYISGKLDRNAALAKMEVKKGPNQ
ncbi:MAG: hypothetical protein O9262_00760 [Cyclobacteriaceae bacterium]|nr:hypothetical protein [Cyclobacteriaceae bacterium]